MPRAIRRLGLGAAIAAVVAGIVLFYRSAAVSSRSGNDVALYSVERYDPYGTAALRDLLADRGIENRTLERPTLLPTDNGVLIQVLPLPRWPDYGLSYRLSTRMLIDWMLEGNTVIQFSRKPTELMTELKIAPTTQPGKDDANDVQNFEASGDAPDDTPARVYVALVNTAPPARGLGAESGPEWGYQRLLLWSPMAFADQKAATWKPLARISAEKKDQVVAGRLAVGKGALIVVGAPTPILNGTIAAETNLDFLLDQIGNRPVIFDEWSHHIGHEATIISFIHDVGLMPFLLQLAVIALLYVWSTTGYPTPPAPAVARQRSSIEQIQTLGYLYNRSFSPPVTCARVSAEAKRRVAEALRCPVADLGTRVQSLKPALQRKLQSLMQRLEQLRPQIAVRCGKCGYDLYAIESDRCPECGQPVAPETRRSIALAASGEPPTGTPGPARLDSTWSDVLTLSHQLATEVERDRRGL
jgi:ribosomal protein L37E